MIEIKKELPIDYANLPTVPRLVLWIAPLVRAFKNETDSFLNFDGINAGDKLTNYGFFGSKDIEDIKQQYPEFAVYLRGVIDFGLSVWKERDKASEWFPTVVLGDWVTKRIIETFSTLDEFTQFAEKYPEAARTLVKEDNNKIFQCLLSRSTFPEFLRLAETAPEVSLDLIAKGGYEYIFKLLSAHDISKFIELAEKAPRVACKLVGNNDKYEYQYHGFHEYRIYTGQYYEMESFFSTLAEFENFSKKCPSVALELIKNCTSVRNKILRLLGHSTLAEFVKFVGKFPRLDDFFSKSNEYNEVILKLLSKAEFSQLVELSKENPCGVDIFICRASYDPCGDFRSNEIERLLSEANFSDFLYLLGKCLGVKRSFANKEAATIIIKLFSKHLLPETTKFTSFAKDFPELAGKIIKVGDVANKIIQSSSTFGEFLELAKIDGAIANAFMCAEVKPTYIVRLLSSVSTFAEFSEISGADPKPGLDNFLAEIIKDGCAILIHAWLLKSSFAEFAKFEKVFPSAACALIDQDKDRIIIDLLANSTFEEFMTLFPEEADDLNVEKPTVWSLLSSNAPDVVYQLFAKMPHAKYHPIRLVEEGMTVEKYIEICMPHIRAGGSIPDWDILPEPIKNHFTPHILNSKNFLGIYISEKGLHRIVNEYLVDSQDDTYMAKLDENLAVTEFRKKYKAFENMLNNNESHRESKEEKTESVSSLATSSTSNSTLLEMPSASTSSVLVSAEETSFQPDEEKTDSASSMAFSTSTSSVSSSSTSSGKSDSSMVDNSNLYTESMPVNKSAENNSTNSTSAIDRTSKPTAKPAAKMGFLSSTHRFSRTIPFRGNIHGGDTPTKQCKP